MTVQEFTILRKLRTSYFGKSRDESLRRFIRRITKPLYLRYQSALLGTFRLNALKRMGKAESDA